MRPSSPAWAGQLTELCNAVGRAISDELPGGGLLFGIHAFCGSAFFDAVTQHPERRAVFIAMATQPRVQPILGDLIRFRNTVFEEYRGRVGAVPFIAADECLFIPVGVVDVFVEAYAPADYVESVNTLALPRYLKQETMPFDKGVQLEAQMNVLPLCTIPRALFTARAVQYVPIGFEMAPALAA
jgi:hypothetical protein